jgi:hypothetical protein
MNPGRNVVVILSAALSGAALSQEPPREGRYDITSCWSSVAQMIALSPRHTAASYEMNGSIRSNPPGGMFDKNTFRCVGSNASLDGKNSGMTVCETVDGAGDKRMTYFSVASDGTVTRQFVAGTGRYEGMTITGTVTPLGPFPVLKPGTFQDCNQQTGTYKLR